MSTLIPLESVRVANPCQADWGKMQGNDRVRFCQSCAKNVFNLSELSKAEAEKLINEKQGNLCVQYYQRADGTVITDDCPVGLKIVRQPFKWIVASVAALLTAIGAAQANTDIVMGERDVIRGDIACPVPSPPPEPQPTPTPEPKE